MPSYAKTYILPRKMRRSSSFSLPDSDLSEDKQNRRQSYARKQSMVTPEFQMSMLKASLEEKNIW